jgi:hypothetical protein
MEFYNFRQSESEHFGLELFKIFLKIQCPKWMISLLIIKYRKPIILWNKKSAWLFLIYKKKFQNFILISKYITLFFICCSQLTGFQMF